MESSVAYYAAAFLAISQLLFMGASYFTYHREHLLGKLLTLYAVGLISYILMNMPFIQSGPLVLSLCLRTLAYTTPAVFWVITHYLFNDNGPIHKSVWVLMGAYIGLRMTGIIVYGTDYRVEGTLHFWLIGVVPQAMMLGFAGHACYVAVRGRTSDLVESRVRMRPLFVLSMGAIISLIVFSGFFAFMNEIIRTIYISFIFVATFFFNLRIFQLHRDFIEFINPKNQNAPEKTLSNSDRQVYEKIQKTLNENKLYAMPGLTIRDLAEALNMKEYRLRQFINKKLSYRNFNQFINEHRLEKAVQLLETPPAEEKVHISTIAWDLGYSSPSSFNKVFKQQYGVTPSEYRKTYFGVSGEG